MKHTHILKNAPEKDKIYRVEYKGSGLYDAKVLNYDGGCWAKVRIENVIPSENEKMYKQGQEFDLKLGYYSLFETENAAEILPEVKAENQAEEQTEEKAKETD